MDTMWDYKLQAAWEHLGSPRSSRTMMLGKRMPGWLWSPSCHGNPVPDKTWMDAWMGGLVGVSKNFCPDGNKKTKMAKYEETISQDADFWWIQCQKYPHQCCHRHPKVHILQSITHMSFLRTPTVMHISTYANKQTYTQQAACVPWGTLPF